MQKYKKTKQNGIFMREEKTFIYNVLYLIRVCTLIRIILRKMIFCTVIIHIETRNTRVIDTANTNLNESFFDSTRIFA